MKIFEAKKLLNPSAEELMFDSDLKEQLTEAFKSLANTVTLVIAQSNHDDQSQLIEMLEGLASVNNKIQLKKPSDYKADFPQFFIEKNSKPVGITFKGIPGGHEFTSLILAILNTDGKGKLPDVVIQNRIKKIKGPVRIQTFISLTCENCPDVVQALNQMALLHPDFQHEMIDGGYVQDDIEKLGIQGVPSIVVNNKMIHSGRITLIDLIDKLEKTFGIDSSAANVLTVNEDLGHFDVVVAGGGPAGVSAAIYSVRKGLKTALLAEKIGGQVQETKGIENLISVVYTEGPQLAGQLAKHVAAYPIQLLEHRRVKNIEINKEELAKSASSAQPKKIHLESGEYLTANAIIIATGAKWRELGIPGEKEYIGRGVAFCPHCDGPYYKGKKVAVVGGGNSGVEAAIDLAGIVREVVLFEYMDQLKADKILVDKLKSLPNVSIVTNAKTSNIVGDGQKVSKLEYIDRSTDKLIPVDLDGVFIQIGLVPNTSFLKDSGVELTKFGEIVVDGKGHTSVPGIYAAGDVTTTPYKQIIIAMGEGAKAALAAFEDRMLKGH